MPSRTTPDEVVQLTGSRAEPVWTDVTRLTDQDLHLFNEGTHNQLADRLGAHPITVDGVAGTIFGVWAPNARGVTVVGDFNAWDAVAAPLARVGPSGVWTISVPLAPGRHTYAFMVDDTVWTLDPRAATVQDPDFGTPSSVVLVGTP